MKKHYLAAGLIATVGASMTFSSCIGQFALTNRVLDWNNQLGNKFVNELVFFAFWVLPVYEVTALADVLVLNSIEFWSGTNPLTASTKVIDTDHGRYLVECDGKGYTVTCELTGEQTRLNFDVPTQTWSVEVDGQDMPFMTMVDANHVKMITPNGEMRPIELNEQGLAQYTEIVKEQTTYMAAR